MNKKNKNKNKKESIKKNPNIFSRIRNFWFPKDFRHQLNKGLYIGTHSKYAPNLETGNPGILFYIPYRIGKLIRLITNKIKITKANTKNKEKSLNDNKDKRK